MIIDEGIVAEPCKIDQDALDLFLTYCEIVTIPKKNSVARAGEPADTLFYVLKGSVSVIVEDEDDPSHDIVLAYLGPGDFIGEMGLFYRTNVRVAYVRTRTEATIAKINYAWLEELFEDELSSIHAEILKAVGLQLSQRLITTNRKVSQLAFMDVAGRIARTLLDLCNQEGVMSHPDGSQLHISRQEIGRVVGCSREMAGRVLKNMADQKMISVSGMDIVVYHKR